MEISIQYGLDSIKLIDKKLSKIDEYRFVFFKNTDFDDYMHPYEPKDILDSYFSLVDKKRRIKNRISESDFITMIKFNDSDISISQALNIKNSLNDDKIILNKLKKDLEYIQNCIDLNTDLISEHFKDSDRNKVSKKYMYESIGYEYNLYDSVNIVETINNLEKQIEDVESKITSLIKTSNALTMIEV